MRINSPDKQVELLKKKKYTQMIVYLHHVFLINNIFKKPRPGLKGHTGFHQLSEIPC